MVLFKIDVPKGKLPVRCRDCNRLLSADSLSSGNCLCGKRTMVTTSYLGLWERIRIKFFGFHMVLVDNRELPSQVVECQAKKM